MWVIAVIVTVAVAVGLSMVGGALVVGASAAIFLHLPFADGWHAAWHRPGMLVLFVVLLIPLFRSVNFLGE
jgi:hypothetical protein